MLVDSLTLKRNIEKKDKRIGYDDIEFVIVDAGKLYVLGKKFGFRDTYFDIVCDASTGEILEENIFKKFAELSYTRKKEKKYYNRQCKLKRLNLGRLEESVKNIRIYQGTIEEVSEDLGRKLERVDIRGPETFIKEINTLQLRLLAKIVGADAIVHYQPGSSIGTPVRFVD